MAVPYYPGLEGVAAVESKLSKVDGVAGALIIAGKPVSDWAVSALFETTLAELLSLALDQSISEQEVSSLLTQGRKEGFQFLSEAPAPRASAPLGQLLSMMTLQVETPDDWRGGVVLIGRLATMTAGLIAQQSDFKHHPPKYTGHAQDFLWQWTGVTPTEQTTRALNTYWIGISDHGMNASTFTARVVASTGANLNVVLPAAIAALSGPLHGGAPGPVLDMLDAIGDSSKAKTWIDHAISRGERIMGIGHRVYKVRDPRAALFADAAALVANDPSSAKRLALAKVVEQISVERLQQLKPGRQLYGNVEFFTAILLEALGIPRTLFTSTFACGRAAGWLAHSLEQRGHGRLLRPRLRYVGE